MNFKFCLLFVLFLTTFKGSYATHLRGGEIQIVQLNNSTTCLITIRVYTNFGSQVLMGGRQGDEDILSFGDGTSMLVPEVQNTVRPDLGLNVAYAQFEVTHTYPKIGSYLVTYREPNRNEGIINFHNSVNTRFFLESYISLGDDYNYQSPRFLLSPIFMAGLGDFSQSLAAKDTNDFKLYYDLKTPFQNKDEPVLDYVLPADFLVNQLNGTITWKTEAGKNPIGEYGFAVKVSQVKAGKIIGYIVRDFQIILKEKLPRGLVESPPLSDANGRIFIPSDSNKKIKIRAGNDNSVGNKIEVQIQSELKKYPGSFSYTLKDSSSAAKIFKIAEIVVAPSSQLLRDNPYLISVRVIFTNQAGEKGLQDITYSIFTKDFSLSPITSLPEERTEIIVYPTHVRDFLNVEVQQGQRLDIDLFDTKGNRLHHSGSTGNSSIDCSTFPAGLYIGSIKTLRGYRLLKIYKE